jgi:4-amino-4-deoxy-L-arabinose transferase-like glycosyltransferase
MTAPAETGIFRVAIEAVGLHATLIVVPCLAYAAFASGIAFAIAGRRRKAVAAGYGTVLALALLGVLLGFFTGNSRSATVQALLPALLTFIAGMAAYLASKEALASWKSIVPSGLVAMLLGVVLSVSHGLALKRLAVLEERDFEQRKIEFEKVQLEVKRQLMLKSVGISAGTLPSAVSGVK